MSSYLQKFAQTVGLAKASWEQAFVKNLEADFDNDAVEKKPYTKSELVYICVSTTARAISQVPLQVMQVKESVGDSNARIRALFNIKRRILMDPKSLERLQISGEIKEVLEPVDYDNPYQMLLDRPNANMNGYNFKEAVVGHILLDGNVWLLPFPPGSPEYQSLWVIKRTNMKPKKNDRNQLESWSYTPNTNKPIPILPEEVVHIKLWSPYDEILGQRPLEVGGISVRSDYKAAVYNEKFFDNGATPGGILHTERKVGEKLSKRIKEQFEGRHKSFKRAERLAVLTHGLKYQQTGLSQTEMGFTGLRGKSREIIMQIFGMKNVIISVTETVNHATAKQQREEWWQDTNLPIMRLVSAGLNYSPIFLNTPYVAMWDVSSVDAIHQGYSDKVKTAADLFKMGFSSNEINSKLELGFDNIPVRNSHFVPVGMINLDEPDINDNGNGKRIEGQVVEPRQIPYEEKKPQWERRAEVIWRGVNSSAIPIEKALEKKTIKVFYEIRKKFLRALSGDPYDQESNSAKSRTPEELLQWIDTVNRELEKDIIQNAASAAHKNALIAGANSIIDEIGLGMDLDLNDPMVIEHLQARAMKVRNVVDTAYNRIKRSVVRGVNQGESVDQIAERIRKVSNVNQARSKDIARTETFSSVNFGRWYQIGVSGFTQKQWFTAEDEKVRETHGEMHGEIINVGEVWVVGMANLRHPGDYAGPPEEVINCRCIEVVVPGSLQQ